MDLLRDGKPAAGRNEPDDPSRRRVLRVVGESALVAVGGSLFLSACGSGGRSTPDLLPQTAQQIAADELAHVRFLRTAITGAGGQPVAKPAINLNPQNLNFASANTFLTLSRAFEDTGVSAYGGAAPLISDKTILGAAARILATEAYHAGNIRFQVVERGITVPALDSSDMPPTSSKLFPTDANGLAVVRTPAQVVAIVAPFFPNGINGTTSPANDLEILNFALNLEYLEAEFYSFATSGQGLGTADTSGTGATGATTGGVRVNF